MEAKMNQNYTPEEIQEKNKSLKDVSRILFGDSAELRLVAPRGLTLLKHNARYFKKEMFKQLVENIKNDQRLSSTPLCHLTPDGELVVLSGNHRVKASMEAEVPVILVIVVLEELTKDQQIAVQLSHNALVGEDDQGILADLWTKIEDIKLKCYAGLSSEQVQELKKVKMVGFTTPQIRTKSITFSFTESEKDVVQDIMAELEKLPFDEAYLIPMDQFENFFRLLQKIKKKENIKNGSLALIKMVELASSALANEPPPEEEGAES